MEVLVVETSAQKSLLNRSFFATLSQPAISLALFGVVAFGVDVVVDVVVVVGVFATNDDDDGDGSVVPYL
jgi:hypothetical protein